MAVVDKAVVMGMAVVAMVAVGMAVKMAEAVVEEKGRMWRGSISGGQIVVIESLQGHGWAFHRGTCREEPA